MFLEMHFPFQSASKATLFHLDSYFPDDLVERKFFSSDGEVLAYFHPTHSSHF